jgi:hypothetical protein
MELIYPSTKLKLDFYGAGLYIIRVLGFPVIYESRILIGQPLVDTWAPSMRNIGHSAQARVSVQRHPYGRRQQFHAGRGVMERRREGIFSQGEKQRASALGVLPQVS